MLRDGRHDARAPLCMRPRSNLISWMPYKLDTDPGLPRFGDATLLSAEADDQ
jgi:hypothetical protein